VVAGCVAQQEGESLLRRCPKLESGHGAPSHATRLGILAGAVESVSRWWPPASITSLKTITTRPPRQRGLRWVNVIYRLAANERCTYCVCRAWAGPGAVREPPEDRSARRSKPWRLGYAREITLLGQNIDAYGVTARASTAEGRRRTRSPTCSITFTTSKGSSASASPPAQPPLLHERC